MNCTKCNSILPYFSFEDGQLHCGNCSWDWPEQPSKERGQRCTACRNNELHWLPRTKAWVCGFCGFIRFATDKVDARVKPTVEAQPKPMEAKEAIKSFSLEQCMRLQNLLGQPGGMDILLQQLRREA